MVRRDSSAGDYAVPYFKELVEGALAHQRLPVSEHTSFYLVQLLARSIRQSGDSGDDAPLVKRFAEALDAGGARQRAGLQSIGDQSLFVSGFFSDSLRRKVVDVDYYAAIGGAAYHALSRLETDTLRPVFAELGRKFIAFADVLNEVSERTSCASNADLLRLYEKWLRTGSVRSCQLLVEKGVVPNPAAKSTRIQ